MVQTWTRCTWCLHLIRRHWFIRMRHCLSSFHLMLHLMTLTDAVLSYQMGGHFRPVAFASCTLTQAQRSYSQLGKASRPHCFLIETISPFSLWSLLYNSFCPCLVERTQMLFMLQHDFRDFNGYILASYNYKNRKTSAHVYVDSMSHLPLPHTWSPKCEKVE